MASLAGLSAILFSIMLLSSSAVNASGHEVDFYSNFPVTNSYSNCPSDSNGQCLNLIQDEEENDPEEMEMDSESNRRMLYWRRRYISYGALFRNRIPCSRRGASYYNCRRWAHVNPYTRGCSAITRCRS